jgi:hypothetical protein
VLPDRRRLFPLLLVLVGALVALTTIQCLSPLALAASRIPSVDSIHYTPALHAREEVGDKGVDISLDAGRDWAQSRAEPALASPGPTVVDDIEIEVSPRRQLLHRRVSPSSPDDGFHPALQ